MNFFELSYKNNESNYEKLWYHSCKLYKHLKKLFVGGVWEAEAYIQAT